MLQVSAGNIVEQVKGNTSSCSLSLWSIGNWSPNRKLFHLLSVSRPPKSALLSVAMEESSSQRRTFTVGLKPAHQLLRCLMVMTGMASSVVLIVKNGEIQILATSPDRNAYASLEMEALTAASRTSDCYAIQFDLSVWIQLLQSSVYQQQTESLWIYKIGVFPDLFCLVGNDPLPIRLGEIQFVQGNGIDMKNLDSHHVKIHMRAQCLREVISAFTPRFRYVGLMAMRDRVTWQTAAGELTHLAENADCLIEGVEPGTAWYLLVRWRGSKILHFASTHSEDVSVCNLTDPNWMDWMRFSFLFDGHLPFLYIMRGSDTLVNI